MHDPTPLVAGPFSQPPFDLTLRLDDEGVGDWALVHGEGGSFPGMSWRAEPTEIDVFAPRNEQLSNDPESWFVKLVIVQRRDATGVDALHDLTLRRIGEGASTRHLQTVDELRDALGDVFGMEMATVDRAKLDTVFGRMQRDREARA
jgi:arylamine N-acetyltransferase